MYRIHDKDENITALDSLYSSLFLPATTVAQKIQYPNKSQKHHRQWLRTTCQARTWRGQQSLQHKRRQQYDDTMPDLFCEERHPPEFTKFNLIFIISCGGPRMIDVSPISGFQNHGVPVRNLLFRNN
jgi:hypothetical protein